ncbi:hypothetical protein [Flavobacterium frigoris]|nr:hypothetical protein [Flavobacterium frigoris]
MAKELITTFKKYEETYYSLLENHIATYEDYDELHFIKSELYFYQNCYSTANVTEQKLSVYNEEFYEYRYSYINEFEYGQEFNTELNGTENTDVKALIKKNHKSLTNGYDLEICDQLTTSFAKITEYLNIKKNKLTNNNEFPKVKFHGLQTEFIELIKALTENGNLKGIQKDNIELCSKFFDIEIKNPDQTLTKLKSRNNGSETLFLDKLKISLRNHFTL